MSEAGATAKYGIDLEVDNSEAIAQAANAFKDLKAQIDADTKALSTMQKALRALKKDTSVNVEQVDKLRAAIAGKKKAIGEAGAKLADLGQIYQQTSPKVSGFAAQIASLEKQVALMPGPLGSMVSGFSQLKGALAGGAIALGVVAIAAALVLLVAASAHAATELAKYAIEQGNARRSELLRLEGLTKLRTMHAAYFGLTAGKASDLQGAIDRVSASSAIGRDKIAGYTDQLYKMGLRGSNLEKVLEGVAIKASTQGEAQAQVFAQWGAGYALTGRSVDGLVDRVKNRLGGIARKQMEDTTVQALKQKEAFDAMFRDIHVDEYLHAAAQVNALLSQSTASGRALKSLLERIVQPLVDAATRAQPIMKRFFQGLIISALLVEIAYLKIRNAWWRTFGKPDTKGIDLTTAALWAGVAAGGALVVVLGLLAAVVASLAIPFAATLALIAAPFVGAWFAIKTLVSLITDTDWSGLASSIWQGLVKGLSSGLTAIATVADDLASSVSRAFTQALGIQSPSKVFMAYGLAIPQGVKLGVEQGTPDAQASVAGMVSLPNPPPTAAAPGAAAPAAGGASTTNASRSMSVTIQNLTVQASGPGAQAQAFDVKRALEQVLEGIAIQSGVPTL